MTAAGLWKVTSPQQLESFFGTKPYEGPSMPSLFIGHGNPMNALETNSFTARLQALGKELPRPRAILCISAHWMTEGTWVTHMAKPKTIHDFYGFPEELFAIEYPAPGEPSLAEHIQSLVPHPKIGADDSQWGLDHGTWTVLHRMYPAADIPVVQLSLDMRQPGPFHIALGQALRSLREQGVLILGSGNIVHNLRRVQWDLKGQGFDWAIEFDEWIKDRLLQKDFRAVSEDYLKTPAAKLSNPSLDHYFPLLYVIGAAAPQEEVRFEYEGYDMGSLSMRCLSVGRKA